MQPLIEIGLYVIIGNKEAQIASINDRNFYVH